MLHTVFCTESRASVNILPPPSVLLIARAERGRLTAAPADATVEDHVPIVIAAQRGDRAAFDALYARFGRYVHAVLLARVPPEAAPDLAQDVFLKAWTMLRTLREPAAFAGWIAALARSSAADHLRGRRIEVELTDTHPSRDAPDTTAEAREAIAAIQDLPEAYRETLLLRLIEGCSGTEIAQLCGLTPDSVRVNLHRGFKLLRQRLGDG